MSKAMHAASEHLTSDPHAQCAAFAALVCNYAANMDTHRIRHTHNLTDSLPSIADSVTHRQNGDNKLKLVPVSSIQRLDGQTSVCTGDRKPAALADGHVTLIDRPQRSRAYHSTCCRLTIRGSFGQLATHGHSKGQGLVSARPLCRSCVNQCCQ